MPTTFEHTKILPTNTTPGNSSTSIIKISSFFLSFPTKTKIELPDTKKSNSFIDPPPVPASIDSGHGVDPESVSIEYPI